MKSIGKVLAVTLLGMLAAPFTLHAADAPQQTTITVRAMCEGCAKKITKRFKEMPEVVAVKTDVKARTVSVTPKTGRQLSPKALWEAVEKSGEQPVELSGPLGTFTDKPSK